jgi:hypothetical protein
MNQKKTIVTALVIVACILLTSCHNNIPCPAYRKMNASSTVK